jgi:hypothetical protein
MQGKWNLHTSLVGMLITAASMEVNMEVSAN